MKVAVSATGDLLESEMDARFGRCPYFIVVNTDDMSHKAFANTNAGLPSGAGIQAAGFLADEGVEAVLTGNCGPKASQAFAAAGISVFTGYAGLVKDALESFKQQKNAGLSATPGPGQPPAADRTRMTGGMGGGRGMGGGCGRGLGGGCGRGTGGGRGLSGVMPPPARLESTKTGNLDGLKAQADQLKQQMAVIEEKIKQLEKGH